MHGYPISSHGMPLDKARGRKRYPNHENEYHYHKILLFGIFVNIYCQK